MFNKNKKIKDRLDQIKNEKYNHDKDQLLRSIKTQSKIQEILFPKIKCKI